MGLSLVLYGMAVAPTGGERTFDRVAEMPTVPAAALSYEGDAPIITGSVAPLFDDPMFTGPNRAEKTGRAAPRTDVAAFSQDFNAARIAIASARSLEDSNLTRQSSVRVADTDEDAGQDGPRMSVASVGRGAANTEGLDAISAVSDADEGTGLDLPVAAAVPDRLAYGRANTPATDFTPRHEYSEREQWCLSTGIYFEARGETYRGQVAVAQVIMNRVAHDDYPDTICGVVYQNQHRRNACQFSFACDGIADRINEPAAWAQAKEITAEVLNEEIYLSEVSDATHYHATYVRPHWARNMEEVAQVGLHVFYRFKPGWIFG